MSRLTQIPPAMISTDKSQPGAVLKDTGVQFEPARDDTAPSGGVKTAVYDKETGVFTITNVDGTVIRSEGFPTVNNIGVGATGPTGPEGNQGQNGRNGKDGRDGVMGCIGPKGDVGPAGPAGGYGGIGPRGPVGPTGPQGAIGLPGGLGPTGPQGVAGPIGPQGTPGPAGSTGPQGIQGLTGATGPQGDKGENGLNGPIGPTGPQGIQGLQGIQGPPGETGPIGQGIPGPAGSSSLFVTETWTSTDIRVGKYASIESGDASIEVAGRFVDATPQTTVTIAYEFNGDASRKPIVFITSNKQAALSYLLNSPSTVEGTPSGSFTLTFPSAIALDFNWRVLLVDTGAFPTISIPATSSIRPTSAAFNAIMEYELTLSETSTERVLVDWETQSDNAIGDIVNWPNSVPTMDYWNRTDGGAYFSSHDAYAIDGDAGAFQYLGGKISVARKTESVVTFLSPISTKNLEFEAIISSTNSDDNTLGLVIAHVRKDGVNHQIVAVRNQGGTDGLSPTKNFMLIYLRNNLVRKVIGAVDIGATTGAWSGKTTKVHVVRQGNVFTAQASPWNSATLDATPLTVDVSTDPALAVFTDFGRYGLMTYAQTDATFDAISQTAIVGDYASAFGVMEFLPGEITKLVQITIHGIDNPTPPPLSLKLLMLNPRGAKLSVPPYGVGTF